MRPSVLQLTTDWASKQNLYCFFETQTTSTQKKAKDWLPSGPMTPGLFLTDHQTEGRGRGQNIWLDAGHGESLLSSWVFPLPDFPQPVFSLRLGLGLVESLQMAFPKIAFALKAPNDIYIGNLKLAGLLMEIESGRSHYGIVGLGINVYSTQFPSATSLGPDVAADEWSQFLTSLFQSWAQIFTSPTRLLTRSECDLALKNLNRFQGLAEKYRTVEADGTLVTESGRILSWKDL